MTTLRLRLGAGSLNQTPLDWENNRDNIVRAIDEAREGGVSLLCLPELCISGYGCEDAFLTPGTYRTSMDVLRELVPHSRDIVVCVGLPVQDKTGRYSTSCLLNDGEISGFVAKKFLAGDGIHYEHRWFKPWPKKQVSVIEVDGRSYPLGDIHFSLAGVKVGFEICEDAWVTERPGYDLLRENVDIILNPSASHFSFGKQDRRRQLVLEGARNFGVAYVYSNLLGNEAGRAIYGGELLIADDQTIVAEAQRFSFGPGNMIVADVDIAANRARRPLSEPEKPRSCVSTSLPVVKPAPLIAPPILPAWERSERRKAEEFARAVPLALFDYLRKSRSSGFVVSLSGGADSAAVASLVWVMLRLASAELGLDGCRQRLFPGMPERPEDPEGAPSAGDGFSRLMRRCLTTVYQATKNSSQTTRQAARTLATALGAEHTELDVEELVQGYVQRVEAALGRRLTWAEDDLALQNIQARVRSPGVWLITNVKGALLLATSNRSEAAVGYATMDGDTSGGVSPIAGVDKAFVLKWLDWLEHHGPSGLGNVPALGAITCQAPTAELRPPSAIQTDEADLMPYTVLDAIERAAIVDKCSPLEVYRRLLPIFTDVSALQLGQWVRRFFTLWSRNQWKRERYAPSFHLDDANLDPKTWCRFPILSGGFERELEELQSALVQEEGASTKLE